MYEQVQLVVASQTKASQIKSKLGEKPVKSFECVGCISPYFVGKYGFSKACNVTVFSGDNCCSLVGLGVFECGDVCVSLGTSDTVFALTATPKPSYQEGFFLCSPIHPPKDNTFMAMSVFKNGSVVREHYKNICCHETGSWAEFNQLLTKTKPGNEGHLGFYFVDAEITPTCKPGIYQYHVDLRTNESKEHKAGKSAEDEYALIRSVVESQFMSFKSHLNFIGLKQCKRIFATGGGSSNKTLLQILADIFGADVYVVVSGPDSAAKGAALRAMHAYVCEKEKKFLPVQEVCNKFNQEKSYVKIASPNLEVLGVYEKLLPIRTQLEAKLPGL
ncbi:hypothetical protein RFI_02668 [Reticulomyxa filosa]|uniref:Carbohydrate kinase FGGY C-terminal domain-containing protein n=1 Tax=Reticulomyxa filosa TaxID=46433 RepID=X6P8C0_RETFI|nr:hypothetical protein RFI_02668 [Reticulomyxa filosa]|eukprot:ETO34426.1 hypothetical protein RFI_02668 [Reticulomyxa filosa]